jgi:hypothetical protein
VLIKDTNDDFSSRVENTAGDAFLIVVEILGGRLGWEAWKWFFISLVSS